MYARGPLDGEMDATIRDLNQAKGRLGNIREDCKVVRYVRTYLSWL